MFRIMRTPYTTVQPPEPDIREARFKAALAEVKLNQGQGGVDDIDIDVAKIN